MSEPRPPDDTGSHLGKTKLISGPNAVPSGARSTASQGGAFDVTGQPTDAHPLPQAIGRFEVRACLGGGAFGWVYRAFDPTLRREVAIKLPRAERLQTPIDRARFLNEARAAATIRHPHVVPVHEIGEMDGTPFIVMGYVPGPTLAAVLTQRKEAFPPHEAAKIVRSLALAVQAAHDKGVVHRDLKPANVLFDPEHAEYVVTDFGLARVVDPSDPRVSTTGIAGTPSYMPPEQARGESAAIGPRSDVYALGVILFELLTGRLPFTGGSVAEVISKVLMAPPPAASSLQANIPPALDAVCRKAMAKEPDDRYSSAAELAATLSQIDEPESLPHATQTFQRSSPVRSVPAKRNTRLVAIIALLLIAVIVAIGVSLSGSSKQKDTAKTDGTQPTIPGPTPVQVGPKTKADPSADRRAAEWVLQVNGTLEVLDTKTGAKRTPATVAELPAEFQVTRIRINDPEVVTDEAVIANLKELSGLQVVDFGACQQLTNVGLVHIARLPALTFIGIRYCPRVTDQGIASLARHPTLRDVYIIGSGMTADGIATLATIPNLNALSFHGHPITDEWLAAASRARGLRQLYCGYSQDRTGAGVSAEGLSHLKELKHLYLLDLDSAALEIGALKGMPELPSMLQLFLRKIPVTDEELVVVLKYPKLEILVLTDARVTDVGMATVAKLASLRTLFLEGTKVGDDGLLTLSTCKSLLSLWIAGTKVSLAGIAGFKIVLPECEVHTKPLTE